MLTVNTEGKLKPSALKIRFVHMGQVQVKYDESPQYWLSFAGRWPDLEDLKITQNTFTDAQQVRFDQIKDATNPERWVIELSDYVQWGAVDTETLCPTLQSMKDSKTAADGRMAKLLAEKRDALALKRYQVETGGITLGDGSTVDTSRAHQAQITTVYMSLVNGLNESVTFKGPNGWVKDAGIDTIAPIAQVINDHVQQAFATEEIVDDQLSAIEDEEALVEFSVTEAFDNA